MQICLNKGVTDVLRAASGFLELIEPRSSRQHRAGWLFFGKSYLAVSFPQHQREFSYWPVSGLWEQEPGMILRQWKEIIRNACAGFGGRRGRFQGGPSAISKEAGRGSRRRYLFCGTGRPRDLKPTSRTLSGTLPCGVRTFLPRLRLLAQDRRQRPPGPPARM